MRRSRLIVGGGVLLAAALTAAAGYAVWFSPVLGVDRVRAVGATAGDAELIAAAAIPLGMPIARVDTASASQRIAQVPWVRSVEVRRGWPDEIVIAVEERIPVARHAGPAGPMGVDAEGVVFTPQAALEEGLVLVSARGPALVAGVQVLEALPPVIKDRVTRVVASTRDDVRLHLRSGAIVRWGSAEEPEFKATVLQALLARRARIYDVSAPQLPTTLEEERQKAAGRTGAKPSTRG